jgi:predicted DsbA family dithiol-disulfide isomerase
MNTKVSKLDVFHKLVSPCLFLLLGAITFYFLNYDKQKQITQLQSEMKSLATKQEETNNRQLAQTKQLDENLQSLRIGYFKAMAQNKVADTDTIEVAKTKNTAQAILALQMAHQQGLEAKIYGEEKAKQLWDAAREIADKEIMDWAKI